LAEGTQEKVMLPVPEAEKIGTVKNFIAGLLHNRITISSFTAMEREIESGNIKPLRVVAKSQKVVSPSGAFLRMQYADGAMESYLNYLIGIVTVPDSASEGQVKQGIDQLYKLILVLRKDMKIDPNLMLIPDDYIHDLNQIERRASDIEEQCRGIGHKLDDISNTMGKRDQKITTILTQIRDFLQTFGPTLKEAREEQEKARKLRGGEKKSG